MKYEADSYVPHDELDETLRSRESDWVLHEVIPVKSTDTDTVTLIWVSVYDREEK